MHIGPDNIESETGRLVHPQTTKVNLIIGKYLMKMM